VKPSIGKSFGNLIYISRGRSNLADKIAWGTIIGVNENGKSRRRLTRVASLLARNDHNAALGVLFDYDLCSLCHGSFFVNLACDVSNRRG